MNHKLSSHQKIARGKRFDENSVNIPGGIIVETERAYETLLFYSVSHCWAGLFMNFMSRNLTQLQAARLKNISNPVCGTPERRICNLKAVFCSFCLQKTQVIGRMFQIYRRNFSPLSNFRFRFWLLCTRCFLKLPLNATIYIQCSFVLHPIG